jgi:thymidylate synthase (FAD)
MQVTYLDHMGTDLSVVNAARVSFGKRVTKFGDNDAGLLNFLAKNKHESPFAHTSVQFHFKAPIFVARQLAKHQIGFSWNEISGRYVELEEFWEPKSQWRKAAPSVKQGSSSELVMSCDAEQARDKYDRLIQLALETYMDLIGLGVCKEQARAVLPVGTLTQWVWTGSLLAWARVWHLRTKKDAQQETRDVVKQLDPTLTKLFPEAWKVLKKWKPVMVEDADA